MRRTLLPQLLIAALAVSGCAAGAAAAAPPQEDAPPRSVEELRARAAAILREEHIPGAAIALVSRAHGIEWAGGIGKADVARGIEVTGDTLFRIGSITKSFVALAVMRLAEEGKLALDARLADVAPEVAFVNPWERTHPVTVAELLEHTAGFDDTRPMEIFATRDDLPLRDVLAVDPRGRTSRWPPGTRYSYSNPDYTILGYLIEKVTGRAYEDYIYDTLLVPLGMTHADLRHTAAVEARLARGYVDTVPTPIAYVPLLHRPAAQMHASAAELAHLVELWLGRGVGGGAPLFAPETIAAMERPRTLPPSPLALGYGFGNATSIVGGWVAHGHTGGLDGFGAAAMYIPEQGVGWVVLVNSSASGNGLTRLDELIAHYLTHGAAPPAPPTGATPPPERLPAYAGYYEFANSEMEILHGVDELVLGRSVFVDGGELWAQDFLERPFRLVPTGVAGGFRRAEDPVTTIAFVHRADGDVLLTGAYRIKRSRWRIWLLRGFVCVAVALMMSAVLFAASWGPRRLFWKRTRRPPRRLAASIGALVASLLGLATIGLLSRPLESRDFLPLKNALTVTLFIVPTMFAVAAPAALAYSVVAILRSDEPSRGAERYALAVALAACALAAWMASCGWIGLRLWAY